MGFVGNTLCETRSTPSSTYIKDCTVSVNHKTDKSFSEVLSIGIKKQSEKNAICTH